MICFFNLWSWQTKNILRINLWFPRICLSAGWDISWIDQGNCFFQACKAIYGNGRTYTGIRPYWFCPLFPTVEVKLEITNYKSVNRIFHYFCQFEDCVGSDRWHELREWCPAGLQLNFSSFIFLDTLNAYQVWDRVKESVIASTEKSKGRNLDCSYITPNLLGITFSASFFLSR
jgi:hypothetical protein